MNDMQTNPVGDFSPLEAAQKIVTGCSQLVGWARSELKQGFMIARHPTELAGTAVWKKVMGVLQTFRARADSTTLCETCQQARQKADAERIAKRNAPPEHPDQTTVHLGPHHVEYRQPSGGIHPHGAPKKVPVPTHPRTAPRHH